MEPLVFVLIVNYQSMEDTVACVASVKKSNYANIRILVVDNASPDKSGSRLSRELGEGEFLQLQKNTGYTGGNNIGIKLALDVGADYVFILNPDIRLDRSTISECVKASRADRLLGAINPIQICSEDGQIDGKFFRTSLKPAGFGAPVYNEKIYPEIFDTEELLGAALFLTTHAVRRVGGFDPLYFAYGEETDLCRRLRYHGFRLGITGRSPVLHLRTKEANGVSDRVLFLRLKGIYLGILKEPRRSFRRSFRLVVKQFVQDLLGRREDRYPFNQYSVTRWHRVRAFIWVLMQLRTIWRHRRIELAGRAHV